MKISLKIIKPLLNKNLLLKICEIFEGSGMKYITGSGQKNEVKRRIYIYENLGKVVIKIKVKNIIPIINKEIVVPNKRKIINDENKFTNNKKIYVKDDFYDNDFKFNAELFDYLYYSFY